MRVRIHRGSQQVGGTCVELESQGKRILLDLGMPLDAEDGEVPMPEVPGITGGDPSLLGVVISHLHGDHCGLVPYAAPGLPLAMGPVAARILRQAEFFTGRPPLPEPTWPLLDRKRFEIGPFTITPYLMEHSAFDAFALLVEADGRRLFYTGDFRAHGNDRGPFERLLADPPRDVHALMMEGTQIGEGRDVEGRGEAELGEALAKRFQRWPGIVLAAWSAQNLDRLRTLHRAAMKAGRTLVIDLYTAALAKASASHEVPRLGERGLMLYCRRRERRQVLVARQFRRTQDVRKWRIFPENLARRAREIVLVFRPSMLSELGRVGAMDEALLVWSLWPGYLAGAQGQRINERLLGWKVRVESHHVSGHAYTRDLSRLATLLGAECTVPIHTSDPGRYAALFPNVTRHSDGSWWRV